MPGHTDHRTVLKTTGGLLAGGTVLAAPVAAQETSLRITLRRERIDPEREDVITGEVRIPPEIEAELDERMERPKPDNFLLGSRPAFRLFETAAGTFVDITDEFAGAVASPVRFYPGPDQWIVQFANEDIRYPSPDDWDGTMDLGVFRAVEDRIPVGNWDTDTFDEMPYPSG